MTCLDGYMNIALENTVEYVDGEQKNEYGDCFIRGNNGNRVLTEYYISANKIVLLWNFFEGRISQAPYVS